MISAPFSFLTSKANCLNQNVRAMKELGGPVHGKRFTLFYVLMTIQVTTLNEPQLYRKTITRCLREIILHAHSC